MAVEELLTTVNRRYGRSTMHGVRRGLYERQAEALALPITFVSLPSAPSNETYERIMGRVVADYADRGVRQLVFADIFLEDVRAYREERLDGSVVEGRWPLWGRDTAALVDQVIDAGFEAVVVAADAEIFDESMVGRSLDSDFLASLPPDVDPCGEHGEFHSFVWDGPVFESPVPVEVGETVTRPVGDGAFQYADLWYAGRE